MREILFRGKRVDNGEWVEGYYCGKVNKTFFSPAEDSAQIIDKDLYWHEVIPETVGQYTGLTDKNGKKIFEGDIVRATCTYNTGHGVRKETNSYAVKYHENYCYFYLARRRNNLLFDGNWSYFVDDFEVIGNIHDNPEFLEVR